MTGLGIAFHPLGGSARCRLRTGAGLGSGGVLIDAWHSSRKRGRRKRLAIFADFRLRRADSGDKITIGGCHSVQSGDGANCKMADRKNNYGKWSQEELRKAEATARQFLEANGHQISETLRAKVKYLDLLVNRLAARQSSLDERLDCFARIVEISQLLKDDAEGFFELASQPVVAQILNTVRAKKK
jgi:hypothetical protein